MKILIITTESQIYRNSISSKRKIKKLSRIEANPIYDEKHSLYVAQDKFKTEAKNLFLGSITEVISLFYELKDNRFNVELAILSSLYGIIQPEDIVTPYWTKNGKLNLKYLPQELDSKLSNSDIIILILDIENIKWMIKQIEPYLHNKKVAIISAGSIKNEFKLDEISLFLPKKGVARIGKKNRKILLDWLINLY